MIMSEGREGGTTVNTTTLVTGIGELATMDPEHGATASTGGPSRGRDLGVIKQAAIVVSEDAVLWTGPASDAPAADRLVDLEGRAVVPGFVDSHTHILFGGDRAREYEARMAGERYDGGGIATTVAATRTADDAALTARGRRLLAEMRRQGTTTVEIKSGYGLSIEDETRLLRIASSLTPEATFLGAHVVPPEYRGESGAGTRNPWSKADTVQRTRRGRADYVDLVIGPMLDACAQYARWADVFCEPGAPTAFDGDETHLILEVAANAGLGLRVHAGQLGYGPGVALAVQLGAASVDHCTYLTDADVDLLADAAKAAESPVTHRAEHSHAPLPATQTAAAGDVSGTVATLLPGVEFSTKSPYPDARRLIAAGVPVALATDCNPGTSFTSSMPFCIALAVREMRMTPAEALWSATVGGALALRRSDVGHLSVGARADLCVLDAPSYRHLAYRPGVPIAAALEL